MEYFDFDEASHGFHARDDDVASDHIEVDEDDNAAANNCTLALEQPLDFSNDPQEPPVAERDPPSISHPTVDNGVYPMFRAKDSCDFCRNMGLDCFVATRGVMQKNGCTCCISLYRECSFTHAKAPGKFLDTLHPINENVDIPTGGLTGKKALKSLSGVAAPEDVEARSRKSTSRLSREAVRVLKDWLYEHKDHPYPSEKAKDELKERTGLKRTQVCNWLANARRRGKVRHAPRSSSPVPGAIDIPSQDKQRRDLTLMTPMERWKHSPPENEPAATTDILRALVNTSLDSVRERSSNTGHVRSYSRVTGSSNDSSHANSNMFHTPSVSSLETSRSATRSSASELSLVSDFSHRSSLGSWGSMERKERRRRRKASAPINPFNQQKARSSRIFQCTFCADSFQTKYDWQRHEKSLHLALEKWTCSPQGGIVHLDGANRCVFCMATNPDKVHLETHNFSNCQEKSPTERTFYRKDHLNQHLRLMHDVKFLPAMEKWRSNTCEIRSRCGFCAKELMTWKDRVDHLATHYKNGASIDQWEGDWGFDPKVQSLVENAMPPYLIGQERSSLDPYTTAGSLGRPPGLKVPDDANCFERLQRQLTAFIHSQLASNVIPTDRMIQDEARQIIYGTDDPWNQTCADNPVWLSVLKRDCGLVSLPKSDHIQFDNLGMRPPYASDHGLPRAPMETNFLARTFCSQPMFNSSGPSSSGIHSPAAVGTGQSSAAPSFPGSSSGSYIGGSGAVPVTHHAGLSADLGSNHTPGLSFGSTPISGSADPLVQMGFEPAFLRRLEENYEGLQLEDLEGLTFEDKPVPGSECKTVKASGKLPEPSPESIRISNSKQADLMAVDDPWEDPAQSMRYWG